MTVTSLLDIRIKPESLVGSAEIIHDILTDTRDFEGNLGVEVVTDVTDPHHLMIIERWESLDHDDAYRAWRAGDGASALGELLSERPTLTRYEETPSI